MEKKESKSNEFQNGDVVFFEIKTRNEEESSYETFIVTGYSLINNGIYRVFDFVPNKRDSHIEKISMCYREEVLFNEDSSAPTDINHVFNPQPHYDNSKGSLYKVAEERGWSTYLFDIVKRLERSEKKGQFKDDLDKSIDVIKLWKLEK